MNSSLPQIILIAHDLRSSYNVGSLLRTCDGLGIIKFIATGTTPYPKIENETRLPHIAKRASLQIAKTALGAEEFVSIETGDITEIITNLKSKKVPVYALEQTGDSKKLGEFKPDIPFALVVGNEPYGLTGEIIDLCDEAIEIPMHGKKESFNVSIAAAIALWELSANRQTPAND